MQKKVFLLASVLCLTLNLGMFSFFSQGSTSTTVSVSPVDDAYVDAYHPDENYGEEPSLVVFDRENGKPIVSYLCFNLSDVPPKSTVHDAQLNLYVTHRRQKTQLLLGTVDSGWKEDTITWTSKPLLPRSNISRYVSSTGQWCSFDVTGAVRNQLLNRTVSFCLSCPFGNNNGYMILCSKDEELDYQLIPKLEIHYQSINDPPTADFSWSANGLKVDFTDSSTDADGGIVSWRWEFGDGESSTRRHPQHYYSKNGTYTVILKVTDKYGETSTLSKQLQVVNINPVANFSYTPLNPDDVHAVTFSDRSFDTDGTIRRWSWSFGTSNTSTEQHPAYVFPNDGVYTVTLTITDNTGATATHSKDIQITNVPPTANFSYSPSTPVINTPITFTDLSADIDGVIQSRLWTFGDGSTSTDQHPAHSYQRADVYLISLTVTDGDGFSNTTTKQIHINKRRTHSPGNEPPTTQRLLTESTTGFIKTNYIFSTYAVDPQNNDIFYWFDWGDGTNSGWMGPYPSGETITTNHSWSIGGIYHVRIKTKDVFNDESSYSSSLKMMISNAANYPPHTPAPPSGPSCGDPNKLYYFTTTTFDPDNNTVKYEFDLGDNTTIFTDLLPSNTSANISHTWPEEGTYQIKARAYDVYNAASNWSSPHTFIVDNTEPTIIILEPRGNQTISSKNNVIHAQVGDQHIMAASFKLLQNESCLASFNDTTFPYMWPLSTNNYSKGRYTVRVTAYDLAGNTNTTQISIRITSTTGIPGFELLMILAAFLATTIFFVARKKKS